MLRSPTVEADLGPYDEDFTYQAEKGRVYNNAIGSGMFTDAFTSDLDDFGSVEERGLIDASSIKMTSYFGENSAGGSTAITVGNVPKDAENSEDAPRVPPWERANDPLLSTSIPTTPEPAKMTENDAPASDLLAFSKQVSGSSDVSTETPATAENPPQLPVQTENAVAAEPVVASTPPSLPPSGPPSKPPTGPPSGPPSSPPSGPPSKPPTGPPSGPPSSPPKSKKPTRPPM